MKKLSVLLLLFTACHNVLAAPFFYNKSEHPIEVTYKFCGPFMSNYCTNEQTTTVKAKSYSHITPPEVSFDWEWSIFAVSVKERKEDNTISARGDYSPHECGGIYGNSEKPENFVIAFDDMFSSPIINCEPNIISGDQS